MEELNIHRGTATRAAGVLMPVASLPSKEGTGTLGREAYKFVDLLADMGIRIWQILPLNPLGYGNSPYQPFSSYAGDELYIDLALLRRSGYLRDDREAWVPGPDPGRIDYERARQWKDRRLRRAYEVFRAEGCTEPGFWSFSKMDWVYPYAVFMALKRQNGMKCWNEWPPEQRDWILDRRYDLTHLKEEIGYQIFVQYLFYSQWMALKDYANQKGVSIMGDVPFYVGLDSLDVWSSREDFLLDEEGHPTHVAGVPPDFFSETGQRWGNPIYDWQKLAEKDFTFWVNRLKYSSRLYNIVRIDHFRAFDTYWKIPASCPTAVEGEWVEAPGYDFFLELYRKLPGIRIVAEDLGDLRPEVLKLRDDLGLMGMNIAQFTLPGSEWSEAHQLIYTGTHDNQTVRGWYAQMDPDSRRLLRQRLAKYGPPREHANNLVLRYVFESKAALAVVPLADILGLDDGARLNTPGTVGSPNWQWRLTGWRGLRDKRDFIRELVVRSGRASGQ